MAISTQEAPHPHAARMATLEGRLDVIARETLERFRDIIIDHRANHIMGPALRDVVRDEIDRTFRLVEAEVRADERAARVPA